MMEVFQESLRWANLPFTILLGAVLAYWTLVGIGFLHFDTGGVGEAHATSSGLGGGHDAHIHAHAETHAELAGDHAGADGAHADGNHDGEVVHPGLLGHVLHFVNVGEVPLMIVLSVLALFLWLGSMLANHYFTGGSMLRVLVFLAPNVLVAAVLTRYVTFPFAKFFQALNREYDEHASLIGRTCLVTTSEVTGEFGQAEIRTKGAPLRIHVRTQEGEPLRKGETGLVVRADKQRQLFFVTKVTPDRLED
jgi:hypothetical protein